jgi:DNA-binding NarL/FixJ family response regulator
MPDPLLHDGCREVWTVEQVRVLIVDDQETFLRAMRAVVDATEGFVVVGEARTGEESLEAAKQLAPHLVLMDVHLPGMDGVEATRLLTEDGRGPVVLLLSTYDADQVDTTGSGATAYLAKATFGPAPLSAAWLAAGD